MKVFKLALLVGIAATTIAYASTNATEIFQAGKEFSERKLTVKVGDTVDFVNDDKTTHNVHSATAGHEFDLGAQAPGTNMSHTFTSAGKVKVRCAIHPKMKISVTVEE